MERVLLAENGGYPLFRISKPGADVSSTNLDDFLINEQSQNAVVVALLLVTSLVVTSVSGYGYNAAFAYPHGLTFTPLVKSLTAFGSISGTYPGGSPSTNSWLVVGTGDVSGNVTSVSSDASYVYANGGGSSSPAVPVIGATVTLASPWYIAIFGVSV